jgi:Ca2+-transporting ATPase
MNQEFDFSNLKGLSSEEASQLQKNEGFNELPKSEKKNIFHVFLHVIQEPMFLLLIACATLYFILGDKEEAIMLLFIVIIIVGITVFQENKTERSLDALRDLSSPLALVIRDQIQIRVPGREVVRGDLVLLSEGDRIPADGFVLHASNFSADESLLTGESIPVSKSIWDGKSELGRPGSDSSSMVYSGSMVVRGQGIIRILNIGMNTEMGKIGSSLQEIKSEETGLQIQSNRLVKISGSIAFALCTLVIIVYGATRGEWIEGILAGLSMAMATIPEEIPVVMTIFLSLGAWRISLRKVLARKSQAIESLGTASVLCTDKTGTITYNRMTVSRLVVNGVYYQVDPNGKTLPEEFHSIVEYSVLASPVDPFDPMEKAMKELAFRTLQDTEHIHNDWNLIREYPLSESLLAMSRVWEEKNGKKWIIASKGSPEAIADLCHLTQVEQEKLKKEIETLANLGLRVIGVARAEFDPPSLPKGQHDFEFQFIGLLGLEDPVRESVPDSVSLCKRAGIQVVMITGDHPGTARHIAQKIGLPHPDKIMTGKDLETNDPDKSSIQIQETEIFARVVPDQKLKIIQSFQSQGKVVAMTGDGVNDAPALKAADIGIAMGLRGTDVAREASDIVLMDDDFSSIVSAVRMGRRIFDNLQKAMTFILAVHIPVTGMSMLPVFMGWPLLLLPVHILFLELIIDPACSIVFEREEEEKDIMDRSPRDINAPLFSSKMLFMGLFQGFGQLGIIICLYLWAKSVLIPEGETRALIYINLVLGNLGMILSNRNWREGVWQTLKIPNHSLWYIIGLALVFLSITLYVPFINHLFKFSLLSSGLMLIGLGTGILGILINEFSKVIARRIFN